MSNKFTGITSAGSAIPVYDKDAHEALSSKLDTTAFSSVSGEFATVDDVVAAVSGKADTTAIPSLDGYATEQWVSEQGYLTEVPESAVSGFATHEEVESATSGKADTSALSGKADTSGVVEYRRKPEGTSAIYADRNTLYNVNEIGGESINVQSSQLYIDGIINATSGCFTANGLTSDNNSAYGGLTANSLTANKYGFKANGVSSYNNIIALSGNNATISAGQGHIDLTHLNVVSASFDTQGLQMSAAGTNNNTQYLRTFISGTNNSGPVQVYSATNGSGAGFMIWAGGAKGFDASGNTLWDTTKSPAPEQLIAGADSTKPSILLSPYMPKSMSAQFSNAPLLSADGYGMFIGNSGQSLLAQMQGMTAKNGSIRSVLTDNSGNVIGYSYLTGYDAGVYHSSAWGGSANSGTWSLTGSVQKREIECDSATSAITAIAGSAIGGGGEVPEGVMVESAVGYNAVNEISGYNGSAIAQYGAEKQWLVHDDTLVHASNSAQYALGINISAVGELLGVSGPVLNQETFAGYWNGSAVYQKLVSGTFNTTNSWNTIDVVTGVLGTTGKQYAWIDAGNSYTVYNGTLKFGLSWALGTTGRDGVIYYDAGQDKIMCRCIDNAGAFNVIAVTNVKYIKP